MITDGAKWCMRRSVCDWLHELIFVLCPPSPLQSIQCLSWYYTITQKSGYNSFTGIQAAFIWLERDSAGQQGFNKCIIR